MKTLSVLTGGGDAPGMNAATRCVRKIQLDEFLLREQVEPTL